MKIPLFYLKKSTTVRAAIAMLALHRFTRTQPKKLPKLGQTELPQHTWRIKTEGHQVMAYAWGSLEHPQKLALLAHGWNGCAWQLHPVAEHLRKHGYTVVAFDQIGHGRSTGSHTTFPQFARVLEKVAATLPKSVDLFVGHSMGAAAGALALSRGMRAEEAVLIAPPSDLRNFIKKAIPEEIRGTLQTLLERREKVDLSEITADKLARKLTQRGLVIVDQSDRETGLEAARAYAGWENATLVVTQGLGHNRILQSPELLGHLPLKPVPQQQ